MKAYKAYNALKAFSYWWFTDKSIAPPAMWACMSYLIVGRFFILFCLDGKLEFILDMLGFFIIIVITLIASIVTLKDKQDKQNS